ncbi:MAG: AbrB/MazE/SpoVT family DNA-binding domain-containing protein [Thermoproteota archaeon]
MSAKVGKYGRIVLPKSVREKYQVKEGSRLIVYERRGEIALIPVISYSKPTEALYGSLKLEESVEEPKEVARKYIRKKLIEDLH